MLVGGVISVALGSFVSLYFYSQQIVCDGRELACPDYSSLIILGSVAAVTGALLIAILAKRFVTQTLPLVSKTKETRSKLDKDS